MSRSRELSEKIVQDLYVAVDKAVDDAIHLAFLQNPNITDGEALKQARKDVAGMLEHYIVELTEQYYGKSG